MGEPAFTPIIFAGIMIALIIIGSISKNDLSGQIRRRQAADAVTGNDKLLDTIKRQTDAHIKYKKRHAAEMMMKQAGMNWKYEKLFLFQLVSAVSLFIVGILMQNFPIAIVFAFCGFSVPVQIISFKKNKRVSKMEQQIGPYLQAITKRYLKTNNFEKSLQLTCDDFVGIEPLHSELKQTVADIAAKVPIYTALDKLAERTQNRFLKRFANFYKISSEIGTSEVRKNLLTQAFVQFDEDRQLKLQLKKEIASPKRSAYIVTAMIPGVFVFGCCFIAGYSDYMFNSLVGQILLAINVFALVGVVWMINNKIGAPVN